MNCGSKTVGLLYLVSLAMLSLGSTGLPASAASQDAGPEPGPPCSGDEYRQFDFWLGEWEVSAGGKSSGTNLITSLYSGCVLREEYRNGPYSGTSINYYDAQTGRWYQTWVDNQGQALRLSGDLIDNEMVLSSDPGSSPVHRITWSPHANGSVRQHWQRSEDGGATWQTVFDGIYTRKQPR